MSVFSKKTKAQIGAETVKQVAKGALAAKEVRTVRTRVLPGVILEAAIGAASMYFLDSATGKGRRHRVTRRLSGAGEHHGVVGQGVEAGGPAHPAPGHMPADSDPDLSHS